MRRNGGIILFTVILCLISGNVLLTKLQVTWSDKSQPCIWNLDTQTIITGCRFQQAEEMIWNNDAKRVSFLVRISVREKNGATSISDIDIFGNLTSTVFTTKYIRQIIIFFELVGVLKRVILKHSFSREISTKLWLLTRFVVYCKPCLFFKLIRVAQCKIQTYLFHLNDRSYKYNIQ